MILILGGTTEGRKAVAVADEAGHPFYYSTLHDFQQVESKNGVHVSGQLDAQRMRQFCEEHGIKLIVDAAHPFAVGLHATTAEVGEGLGIPVVRFERRYPPRNKNLIYCDDYADAVQKMQADGVGRLLALTGVQTIGKLREFWSGRETWFRILNREDSREKALKQGFDSQRLVYYDDKEPEGELFARIKPDAIITKESGESGGFAEKVKAALDLGIKVYVVKRPELPASFITVDGEFGLRKQIERLLPGYFKLRSGFTTGACATAAARAALIALMSGEEPREVLITIPNGERLPLSIESVVIGDDSATATVVKDAGDDPDVTNGCHVRVAVRLNDCNEIRFFGGEGIGTVTLPGLGLEVGQPAINPMPRKMIGEELAKIYEGGVDVTVSIPEGVDLAEKTFNPRVGVVGGISVIGTLGVVRPFSHEAFIETIRRQLDVCLALGIDTVVFNSGAKSEKMVRAMYPDIPSQAFIHYGNAIGEALKLAADMGVRHVIIGLMIGKAVKLAEGNLDTHSHNVTMNRAFIAELATESGCSAAALKTIHGLNLARQLWTELRASDSALLLPAILKRCAAVCTTVYPYTLTPLLISEAGQVVKL